MKKYRCILCGFEFESDEANPVCPLCGATGDDIVEITDEEEESK